MALQLRHNQDDAKERILSPHSRFAQSQPTNRDTREIPSANPNERPTSYADRVGSWYVSKVTAEHRQMNGLYLTPIAVADFMSSLHDSKKSVYRLLDPAAGAGILLCSLVEKIVGERGKNVKQVNLTAYEIDSGLIPCLAATMKHLGNWCSKHGVTLDARIECKDFILSEASSLEVSDLLAKSVSKPEYDVVISNPPYFKINKNDPRALAAASVVHGQPNIYGLFMAVGASILSPEGEFIYITPRSFASGQYFKALRERLFTLIRLDKVHIFESRIDAFNRDEVLQENIILKGIRKTDSQNERSEVIVSSSHGAADIDQPISRVLPITDLLDEPKGMTLRLPTNEEESHLLETIDRWTGTLEKYGLKISTGQVVPFRATDLLDMTGNVPKTHTPLLWMNHINAMHTHWPKDIKKPQYIKNEAVDRKLLIDNKNYVLLRRFSAKEEKRRLNAVPYLAQEFNTPLIAFENHLNYIHRPKSELKTEEAVGLAALLNSKIMNRYYRIINGNTQVSATELRVLPLPPHELIITIGRAMLRYNGNSEAMIDKIVTQILDFPQHEKQEKREEEYA